MFQKTTRLVTNVTFAVERSASSGKCHISQLQDEAGRQYITEDEG